MEPRIKFVCPKCNKYIKGKVRDVQLVNGGIKRYRKCEYCETSFVTFETIDYVPKQIKRRSKGDG